MTELTLVQMLAVTAELTGTQLSDAAAEVLATELAQYPRDWIVGALRRCRRELRTRLTMAEILDRIDDGRPGPDEAFAMLARHDADTAVITDEMAKAMTYRNDSNDPMTQRRAFTEAYKREVAEARLQAKPVHWWPSLGHDVDGREAPVAAAVADGRLTLAVAHAAGVMLPAPNRQLLELASTTVKALR